VVTREDRRGAFEYFDAERVLLRMLKRLVWCDVLEFLETDGLRTLLRPA
jgi:hypothetical protein